MKTKEVVNEERIHSKSWKLREGAELMPASEADKEKPAIRIINGWNFIIILMAIVPKMEVQPGVAKVPKIPSAKVVIVHKTVGILKFPRKIGLAIDYANAIIAAIIANPATFPTPSPATTDLQSDVADLIAKQNVALTHAKGACDARNVSYNKCKADFELLLSYVNGIASASPANAATIIKSACMSVKGSAVRQKISFGVIQIGPGTVEITAERLTYREAHEWNATSSQLSEIVKIDTTLKAKTVVPGLTKGVTYTFTHRTITKNGPTAWDSPISLMISY